MSNTDYLEEINRIIDEFDLKSKFENCPNQLKAGELFYTLMNRLTQARYKCHGIVLSTSYFRQPEGQNICDILKKKFSNVTFWTAPLIDDGADHFFTENEFSILKCMGEDLSDPETMTQVSLMAEAMEQLLIIENPSTVKQNQ